MRTTRYLMATLIGIAFSATATAHAHPPTLATDSNALITGLSHPWTGWDHLTAALAVGLWAAWRRGQTLWTLPVVFIGVIALSGVAALSGLTMPLAETGIGGSLLVLGLLLALAARPPLVASVSMVGLFAVFHGYAHATGMPPGASPLVYGFGLVVSTTALLALGVGLGRSSSGGLRARLLQWAGGAIAAAGILSWV